MRARWLNLVVILGIAIPLVWCFGPSFTGHRVFAYRDSAHFYYPLESWICRQWAHGHLPLWNAQDGNGMPVVADATSTVWYPGKLLFALPLEFSQRYAWYTIAHVLLAASGAYTLARRGCPGADERGNEPDGALVARAGPHRPGVSRPGATLCAVAYAFSGAVLFQYCNVVFLIGAAWLPWALLATHRLLTIRRMRWALTLGACLALMVLGGDPQAAYHTGLLAALYALITHRAKRSGAAPHVGRTSHHVRLAAGTFGWLACAAGSGVLLSAVQIVPSWSWIAHSDRLVFSHPRSIYEIPAYLCRQDAAAPGGTGPAAHAARWTGVAQGLWGSPAESEHHRQTYRFSVAPWRLAEMLWPNVSGRTFPQNHRWLIAAGGEDVIWTPSLYLGTLPLLLALGTWRLRRADPRVQWLSWIALLAVLASFGCYGLGLLGQSLQRVFTAEPVQPAVAGPVGGLYWLMTVLLPGYVAFRYPAKLLVMASLALAALAGIGFDRMLASGGDRLVRHLQILGAASLLAALVVAGSQPWWASWLADAPPDELYGPLVVSGAWQDALIACGHTVVVCGAGWWLLRRGTLPTVGRAALLVLLTAGDIAWANGWLVLTAPASAMHTPTVLAAVPSASSPCTVYRWPARTWVPCQWPATSSPDRPAANVRWDTATLYAKLHLLGPHRSLLPQTTISARDFRAFVKAGGDQLPAPTTLDVLGVEYLILPDAGVAPAPAWQKVAQQPSLPGVHVWKNPHAFPRAWVVHDVEVWPTWESTDPQSIAAYYRTLLFPQGQPRDLRHTAIVEQTPPALFAPASSTAAEPVRVRAAGAQHVELEATLAAPGLLVLNQFYDPRWVVDVNADSAAPVRTHPVRVNRIMQGVYLPAGTHRLTFSYVPRDLYCAGAVSALSWLALLLGLRNRRE